MTPLQELQTQLHEAEYLAKFASTESDRMLKRLVANIIRREIERLQEEQQ